MTRKFLQLVGALTVFAILGAGAVAVFFVKQRFVVTFTDEASTQKAGPSPLSLLRDDVAALRADLESLTSTLSKNFETLATQAEERDGARAQAVDARLSQLSTSLAALSDRLASAVASSAEADTRAEAARRDGLAGLASLRAAVDRLAAERAPVPTSVATAARAAELPAPPPPVGPSSGPESPTSSAAPPAPPPPAPPTSSAAPPAPPRPIGPSSGPERPTSSPALATSTSTPAAMGPASSAPAPARKRGFLSFALPSESLDLAQRLRFEIVPSLSRVGFDAKSTLHDFSGVTSEVSGSFTARLSQPGSGTTGRVEADAATLDTKEPDRDVEMRQALDTTRFPTIAFELTSFEVATVDPKTFASSGTARGRITIHGVTHEAAIPLRISVDAGRRVLVDGETPLRLTDYGVAPPSKAGLIKVDDQVRIWLSLRARATGKVD